MKKTKPKNPHAVALGRKGGKARMKTMTDYERSQAARHAANCRHSKNKQNLLLARGGLTCLSEV